MAVTVQTTLLRLSTAINSSTQRSDKSQDQNTIGSCTFTHFGIIIFQLLQLFVRIFVWAIAKMVHSHHSIWTLTGRIRICITTIVLNPTLIIYIHFYGTQGLFDIDELF